MPACMTCKKPFGFFDLAFGECPDCRRASTVREQTIQADVTASKVTEDAELRRIILTTETAHNLPVAERLDIVSAEVVIGMHLFKDVASAFRDVFGGRSKVMQDGLRDARKTALAELRREAHALGADAVVGVDLDYSEISGGGKSMLFLVACGTAVTLSKVN
jgi:uncharacterized protein YbjQ (UPF0145 family)